MGRGASSVPQHQNTPQSIIEPLAQWWSTDIGFDANELAGIAANSEQLFVTTGGQIFNATYGTQLQPASLLLEAEGANLAVSDTHIYWGTAGLEIIGRAQLNGSNPEPEFLKLAGEEIRDFCVLKDGTIFVITSEKIERFNPDGTGKTIIVGVLEGESVAITTNGTNLVWKTLTGLFTSKLDGSSLIKLTTVGETSALALACNDKFVYYGDSSRTAITPSRILRILLNGSGAATPLITIPSEQSFTGGMVLARNWLFFVVAGKLGKVLGAIGPQIGPIPLF